MSALSNLKRNLLSTVMAVPLRGGILDFPSTMAGHIFAHTKTIPPASARAYAQREFEKCVEREKEFFASQAEDNDETRHRWERFKDYLMNHYLPALERWERAEIENNARSTVERAGDTDADPDVVHRQRGYSHRVDAWVHPMAGGDDYPITFYGRGAVNHDTIQAYIGRQDSAVMTDYSVTPL